MLARIQKMRLMDDDFMTVVFSGNNKLTELLLSILLDRNDLRVRRCTTARLPSGCGSTNRRQRG